jgi:hypothetical protein
VFLKKGLTRVAFIAFNALNLEQKKASFIGVTERVSRGGQVADLPLQNHVV